MMFSSFNLLRIFISISLISAYIEPSDPTFWIR